MTKNIQGIEVLPESLQVLASDRWDALRKTLARKSVVLCYVDGYNDLVFGRRQKAIPPLMQYVVEQCSSFLRLMTISAAAYEKAIAPSNDHGLSAWLSLTCAYSSIDALAAAIVALVLGETFPEEKTPGIGSITSRSSLLKGHSMMGHFDKLRQLPWYESLHNARNRVVHRAFWPRMVYRKGWCLVHGPSWWESHGHGLSASSGPSTKEEPFSFAEIMHGYIEGLEEWELSIAKDLKLSEQMKPLRRRPVTHYISLEWGGCFFPKSEVLFGKA